MGQRSNWHHYVAQGLLSNFCYEKSKIWYYSKRRPSEGVASRDIGKKFRKRHYYSIDDVNGIRSDVLERDFLQILDSRIVEFVRELKNVVDAGRFPQLDAQTKGFLRQFIYYQAKRNPDFEAKLGFSENPREHVEAAIDRFENKFGPVSDAQKAQLLSEESVNSTYRYGRVISLARHSPNVAKRLDIMSCHFAFPPKNKQFLISSNPVVRLENKKGGILGDGTVEIWTPLTPKILVGFIGPREDVPEFIDLPESEVRKVNVQMFKQSAEIGGASEKLIKSVLSAK